jgi:hypothetical protein
MQKVCVQYTEQTTVHTNYEHEKPYPRLAAILQNYCVCRP